jgi:hypothetical protein
MQAFKKIVLFSFVFVLLSACGPSNTVRLLPLPNPETGVLPAPNAPRVSVVAFEDRRLDQSSLGLRRDSSAFVTNDNVAQWISKALADELARNGLQVSYALSAAEALQGQPDYLVTGYLTEAGLREITATEMVSSLSIDVSLARREARILRESMHSSQSRTSLPAANTADNLMQDTLYDLVKSMSRKIVLAIENK